MKRTLHDIIIGSASAGLELQDMNGAMPAGNNGPYKDMETPVRNTSHWLITFLKAYEVTNKAIYHGAAEKCLAYLMSPEARPMEAVFWHRKNPKKDFSNGLMGQAWTLEALIVAYEHFKDDKILALAEEVYLKHPYDEEKNAWKTVNVDGSIHGFDVTFNHQLWFSAVGTLLGAHGNAIIKSQTQHFNDAIHINMEAYPNGVIKHYPIGYLSFSRLEKYKAKFNSLRFIKDYMYFKSVGYHGFNLYALALIHSRKAHLPIFQTAMFRNFINVIGTETFIEDLNSSKYGFPYNPPGPELGYSLQEFGEKDAVSPWLEQQFAITLNPENGLMNLQQKDDPHTAAARIYEACRLDNYNLDISSDAKR